MPMGKGSHDLFKIMLPADVHFTRQDAASSKKYPKPLAEWESCRVLLLLPIPAALAGITIRWNNAGAYV